MKVKINELVSMNNAFHSMLNLDCDKVDPKHKKWFEFNLAITDNILSIKNKVEEIQEKLKVFDKEQNRLLLSYCSKDDDGNVIIEDIKDSNNKVVGKKYVGLEFGQNREYDELSNKVKEEKNKYLNEEITIKEHKICKSYVPRKLPGKLLYFVNMIMDREQQDENE